MQDQDKLEDDSTELHAGKTLERVYVFQTTEEKMSGQRIEKRFWRYGPSVCGSLISIPFGIMLGWPSPAYPALLQENSTIWITLDQSAMVAGFLMLGNTASTPFSQNFHFGPKYGVLIGSTIITLGWITMWQATNIYWLLTSRFLVGFGNGYGIGQVKNYISDMCTKANKLTLIKQLNFYTYFGVILAYVIGSFTNFRQISLISTAISVLTLFLIVFLPRTPKELVYKSKYNKAKSILTTIYGAKDYTQQLQEIQKEIGHQNNLSLWTSLKTDSNVRNKFFIFIFLTFFQQFVGVPATIVYCQVLLCKFHCPYPQYSVILYAITFFIANLYGVYYSVNFQKKKVLILSNSLVIFFLVLKVLAIYYDVNRLYFPYISFTILLFFITSHTIGMGNIPITFTKDFFPENLVQTMTHIFIMCFSIFALVITKIFQVLLQRTPLYVPFCLFLGISIISIIFIMIFVPSDRKAVLSFYEKHTLTLPRNKDNNNLQIN